MVIGLSGAAQSGKNTFASGLERAGYETIAFADPLREMVALVNPIVGWNLHQDEPITYRQAVSTLGYDVAKKRYPEVRRMLQFIGTEVVRQVKPTYWTEYTATQIRELNGCHRRVVVADVRFENEADVIRDAGGIVVEIYRPGLATLPGAHVSEAGVEPDLVVVNDSTPESLYERGIAAILAL